MIVDATYTSVFDDSITCTSNCKYDTESKTVSEIDLVESADNPDAYADSVTDEYVTVNGRQLREEDGVTFDF
jgi:hypothetical protein